MSTATDQRLRCEQDGVSTPTALSGVLTYHHIHLKQGPGCARTSGFVSYAHHERGRVKERGPEKLQCQSTASIRKGVICKSKPPKDSVSQRLKPFIC